MDYEKESLRLHQKSLKVVGKRAEDVRIVTSGAG